MKLTAAVRKTILLVFSFLAFHLCNGQNSYTDSTNETVALDNAIDAYHLYLLPETGLFNGREYRDYSSTIKTGNPFFYEPKFNKGTVEYDGILYKDVPLLYDIVAGDVVITDSNYFSKVRLVTERVSRFSILDHVFTKLLPDSNNTISAGFYEVLYSGNTCLYKKQVKQIQEAISMEDGVRRFIVENVSYYLKKDGRYYYVNSKSSLLKILKDQKKELTVFIKKQKLDMKKAKDQSFIQVAGLYDQLSNGRSLQ